MIDKEMLSAISNILDERFGNVYARMDKMDDRISGMDSRISEMESRLEQKIENIRIHLENDTDKKIQLLVENYVPAAKRFEKEADTISEMRTDIVLLKKVVQDHSELLHSLA